MDGQLFSHSLFALKGDDLRIIFSLLSRTNISNILSSKTKDLLSVDEQDSLQKHILHVVKKLEDISDDKLRFYLFLEITKVLGIKGVRYTSEEQIGQQATKIVDETYKLLEQQEKDFIKVITDNDNSKLQQILIFQIEKILINLNKIYLHFGNEVKLDLTTKLFQYINVLSVEKQEQIKNEWAVTMIDVDTVNMVMTRGSLNLILNTLRRIEGFAFYIHLAPFLFPFLSQNQLKDTTLNVKWIIDPSNHSHLIGLSDILRGMHHNDFQKRLLPIIMTQMSLLYLSSDEEQDINPNIFINEWKNRFQKYISLKVSHAKKVTRQENLGKEIRAKTEILEQLEINIPKCIKSLEKERESILSALKSIDLNKLEISRLFHEHLKEFNTRKDKIAAFKKTHTNSTNEGSILKKVSNSFANLYREYNLIEEEKKLELLLNKMIHAVINSTSSFCQSERESFNKLTQLLKQLNEQKVEEEASKLKLENELNFLNKEHFTLTQTISNYEQENYGLKDITLSLADFNELEQEIDEERWKKTEQNDSYLKKKQLFINNYESKIKKLEQQNEKTLGELADKELKIISLQQQTNKRGKEVEELTVYKKQVEELEREKHDLINQNHQLIEKIEKETKRLLQEQHSNWEYKYHELKEAAEKQNKQLHQMNQEWKAKYKMLDLDNRTKQQLIESEKKLRQREQNSLNNSLATVRQQLEEKERNNKAFQYHYIELEHQISNLKVRLNQATLEKEKLHREYQTKLKDKENLSNQQIIAIKTESERKLNQLTNYYSNDKQLDAIKLENKQLHIENSNIQNRVASLKNQIEEKANNEKALLDQLSNQENERKKISTLNVQINQLEAENKLLLTNNQNLVKEHKIETEQLLRDLHNDWEKKIKHQENDHSLKTEKRIKQLEQEWNLKLHELKDKYESQIHELNKEKEKEKKSKLNLYEDIDDLDLISFGDDDLVKI